MASQHRHTTTPKQTTTLVVTWWERRRRTWLTKSTGWIAPPAAAPPDSTNLGEPRSLSRSHQVTTKVEAIQTWVEAAGHPPPPTIDSDRCPSHPTTSGRSSRRSKGHTHPPTHSPTHPHPHTHTAAAHPHLCCSNPPPCPRGDARARLPAVRPSGLRLRLGLLVATASPLANVWRFARRCSRPPLERFLPRLAQAPKHTESTKSRTISRKISRKMRGSFSRPTVLEKVSKHGVT